MNNLPDRYNSKDIEAKRYSEWEAAGYFRPQSDGAFPAPGAGNKSSMGKPYVIVIPPPNVTGILHMGHALNNSIQDILTRWNRMRGRDALWIPGVDHAGIATQNVVEKKLAKEKITRHTLGREKFLEQVWKWKEEYGGTITRQLRRLGASCDWSRERFTMDEGLSRSVRECFVTLYERGLIYQGNYIINWCPRCQTALSDEESAHKDVQGGLYHIKYPIEGRDKMDAQGIYQLEKMGEDHVVVATTRPETMLGDAAVAVHPEDPRYKHLIGKTLILPLLNREIPIIADSFVDPEFGTGFVKVTPAHDPNDFAMGQRHDLPQINVMHPDGKMNAEAGPYAGLDRFEARKRVIADLEAKNLFVKRDTHMHAVGHCYRCNTVVEPYLSKQWFVKMKPLAEKALKAHAEGKTKFYPDRWTKVYTNWLEGIRDWCISRQIWWGHQIPVWYCESCKQNESALPEGKSKVRGVIVSRTTPANCPDCGNANLVQDPDVLDTWFSSWLWPFSTLGWPEKTKDLKHFYPTSDLVTASEIIFFWVSRMIMAGLEFMDEVPFSRIYIHGTVRAEGGLKMSKSLGNSIDPLEVIEEMGADALRYSMIMLSAQDVYLSREKFEVGRNFTNKIWNAARFVLMNLEGFKDPRGAYSFSHQSCSIPQRWILSRLAFVTAEIDKNLDQFALSQAATELYHFVWNDFCDWFLELSKASLLGSSSKEKETTQQVLFYVLEKILRLLHPFVPFITEEIWQKTKEMAVDQSAWPASVSLAAWPGAKDLKYQEGAPFRDESAEALMNYLQKAISGIRDIRARLNLPAAQLLPAVIHVQNDQAFEMFKAFDFAIKKLGRLETVEVKKDFEKTNAYMGTAFADFAVFIRIEGLMDPEKERVRIGKKIAEAENWVRSIRGKLANENFVKNAPAEIIQREKTNLEEAEKTLKSNQELLELFKV